CEVMDKAKYYMGLLVASVVNLLDPEVIVFGGGIVERLGADYIDPVRETAEHYYLNQQDKDKIQIVESTLKDNAGVLGAAIMANQAWQRDHKHKKH
ncbi:MAG: ROK family protein, partial [Anaerolineae bacterium]|nr:ROK family protein [Anaerolineae bacterium]